MRVREFSYLEYLLEDLRLKIRFFTLMFLVRNIAEKIAETRDVGVFHLSDDAEFIYFEVVQKNIGSKWWGKRSR
jgi:hypothetical protein